MEKIVLLIHVVLAVGVIAFVLLQRGKGADAGASFGGGASQTVFGSEGSGNFLTRTTGILVTGFFVTSMALAFIAQEKANSLESINVPVVEAVETDVPAATSADENALPAE
ncbi:preprotein translocase subunit SecG [Reinekea marina]|nr:preprotein translocase subunit SecG [Reinekea marina]MBU2865031.1 preprotein translocase subunit SecG [Reinekea forsetii]MDN3648345.1 preprotein translocase subunit SecG [Reinekea marina]